MNTELPIEKMGNDKLSGNVAWRDRAEDIPMGFYFLDEIWADCCGPFKTRGEAEEALDQYETARSGPTPEEEAEAAEIIYQSQLDQVREYNQ